MKKKIDIVGFTSNEELVFNESLKIDPYNSREITEYITSLVAGKQIQEIQILEINFNSLIIGIPIDLRINFADNTSLEIRLRFETSSIWSRMSAFFNYSERDILSQKPMTYYRKKVSFHQRIIAILKDKLI
ncbi:hypothetical protein [Leptospira kmetyi]|uniref:Uncharacterized protein n=1 Tax=Leptospira kmetyi TaxID=408139 RepID=A0ABX4N6M0_9LEPT|nr:hypothetical protein [Leptospira kmetyi]PJZ28986.1 hypothetical protein CH378_15175 [Leptospira kmetyi]